MRHVIIGASSAGIAAARAIRELEKDADISLLSREQERPYYRHLISSVLERGDADISYRDDPIGTCGVKLLHDEAVAVDVPGREVVLASRGRLSYDRLLIATGSSPVMPDIPGLRGPDVFAFRTRDDARNIQSAAQGKRHAVVLGGGFVGIKAAEALSRLGLRVTLLEKLGRLLYEKLDQRGSSIIADHLRRNGIEVVTHQQDYEVVREGAALQSLRLASGRIIPSDLIIAAVGTTPNTRPFRQAGIAMQRGITVTELMETSVAGIYAAGDVVECRDVLSQVPSVSAFWQNAEEMGRVAGRNMAGVPTKYDRHLALLNDTDVLDLPVMTVGLVNPSAQGFEVHAADKIDSYRKLVFRKDVLAGAVIINGNEDSGMYTYLIRNQVPLGRLKDLAIEGRLHSFACRKAAAGDALSSA